MKKLTLYVLLVVSILTNLFLIVQPSNLVHAESAEKDTSDNRVVYYYGVWNQCLTDVIALRPDIESNVTEICKQSLKTALDNKFYEYRMSDMFDPLPRDVIPMYKVIVNPNIVTFDISTAKKYNTQGYSGYTFQLDDGGKLVLELTNPQHKPGLITCKGDFDTKTKLNQLFPNLGC